MFPMRVLFDHPFPFFLTHGGFQTQIEQTKLALEGIGVEVDFVRWWDERQHGDVIHYFGRPTAPYIDAAHNRGMKVVLGELLSGTASRSWKALRAQKAAIQLARRLLPDSFTVKLAWNAYTLADAIVANTNWEARLMEYLFDAPTERIHVVSNSVESDFFDAPPVPRGKWLVCTATITDRKRVAELAEAAVEADTPTWIIGKPYSDTDPYAQRFATVVKRAGGTVRYEGPVHDRTKLASIYREARGFVLLSSMETLSFSALEAAACQCPMLLSDLPWARTTFGNQAQYCPVPARTPETARCLRSFYDQAPILALPPKPPTWREVGEQFRAIYERVLNTSR